MAEPLVRILYVNSVNGLGGAEISLLQLASHLGLDKFKPHLVTSCAGPLSQRFVDSGIPVFYADFPFFSRRRPWVYARAIVSLRAIIRKNNVGLVHVNCDRAVPHAVLAAKLSRVPCVCHVRDMQRAWFLPSYVRYLNRADTVIANSQATRAACVASGIDEARLLVAYPGVDLTAFLSTGVDDRRSIRQEFGLQNDSIAVGIIGQVMSHKGHEEFIRAAAMVLSQCPQAVFFIVGDDSLSGNDAFKYSLVNQIETQGLSGKVRFTGFRDDIHRILSGLDIVAVPSWNEPFGRVVVEALASGRPVVATDVGGIPEIIEHGLTGILIPPRDASALADSLTRLCCEPELRHTMGEKGLKAALRFDVNRHAREVESIYMSLLNRKTKDRQAR